MENETVPQTQPLDGDQVMNNAGGYVYEIDDLARLKRFLILGSEGSNYYVSQEKLAYENAQAVSSLLSNGQGPQVVAEVVAVSSEGRAPKQSPGLLVLAMCARLGDQATKRAAMDAVPLVCRTASTLFEFVERCTALNPVARPDAEAGPKASWGRAMRRAVAEWYLKQEPLGLAYQVTKYRERNGWTHRDLMRLSHPNVAAFAAKVAKIAVAPPLHAQEVEEKAVAAAGAVEPAGLPQAVNEAALQAVLAYIVKGKNALPFDADAVGDGVEAGARPVVEYLVAAERLRIGIRCPSKPKVCGKRKQSDMAVEEVEQEGKGEVVAAEVDPEQVAKKEATAAEVDLVELEKYNSGVAAAAAAACALIKKYRFSWEHVGDSMLLKCPEIWHSILENGMPMTALMRNLGRLTAIGVLDSPTHLVAALGRFQSKEAIRKARLHPISLLEAQRVYSSGSGQKGSLSWVPVKEVADALEGAFYMAFKDLEPTGKRFLAAVDVSGSMWGAKCTGMSSLNAREAAACMLMSILRTEQETMKTMAFSSTFMELPLKPDMDLDTVIRSMDNLPFNATDCSLPMQYALKKHMEVDVFLVLTDNETFFGKVHPMEALRRYRKATSIDAALIVMAFSVSNFSIADPEDPRALDVAGLDSAVPQIVHSFVVGEL